MLSGSKKLPNTVSLSFLADKRMDYVINSLFARDRPLNLTHKELVCACMSGVTCDHYTYFKFSGLLGSPFCLKPAKK